MKAIVYTHYGSPDVLQWVDVEKPTPNDDQVLVKVHATALNPLDWHMMRADPFIVRMNFGFLKPKRTITPGADIAGVVEAVGKNVTRFKVGDAVFGDVGFNGGCAEYVATNPSNLTLKPANVSFEEAAATPVAALTAIQGLRHGGAVKPGDKVLVNGASGGVGSYTVQFAKAAGAHVTAVCSGRNAEMVRGLGADAVVDYTRADFSKQGLQYDLIYDAIGNISAFAANRALKPGGRFVIVGITSLGFMIFNALTSTLMSKISGKQMGLMGTAGVDSADLESIRTHLENKQVVSLIDRRYPLNQTADGLRYLETGRARGKVIVTVS